MSRNSPEYSPLGKKTQYVDQYDPSLLFPIARKIKRDEINIDDCAPPFIGCDVWNAYEISFLNEKGKPIVAVGRFEIPASSKNIIESKSFKLYLNSFNNSRFQDLATVARILEQDLAQATVSNVRVSLWAVDDSRFNAFTQISTMPGEFIDNLDVCCEQYEVEPQIIQSNCTEIVEETLVSNLLKSNCLVTGQPDWGTVSITYRGHKLDREALLKYIVSFRNHNEFHEQCVERIFVDLMRMNSFEKLEVDARYTRRGGLDICPFRSTEREKSSFTARLTRQ